MKKRRNSITKLIACVLVLTLSLTILQPLSIFAQQDISSPETKSEKWIPSKEDMQLPNTAGDLTIEQLETAKLSAEDIPEFITDKEIKGKGHVNRLREQEPDDNTVVFQNRDGTKTAYFFSSPVKYTDENGNTKDKHTKLESKNIPSKHSEKYGYVNQKNNIKTYFPKQMTSEQGMLLESEDISVELLPLDATEEKYVLQNGSKVSPGEYFSKNKTATMTFSSNSVSDDVAKIQNKKITAKNAAANKIHITEEFTDDKKDTIQYDDVFGSETTLRYSSTFNGLKEDIILYENTGVNNFRFKLKTNGLSLVCNEHGEYYLADPLTGENFVAISELLIYDSNNKVYKNEYAQEYNHYYEVKTIKPDEEYILSVVVDEEFLNSPDTVYPVYIDPTMTVVDKGLVDDATLYSTSEERASSGQVKIGYNGTTYGKSRGLYNFPITKFNMDFILMYGNQIESADLNLYALQYGNSSSYDDAKKLSMYQFDSPWTYYTVKWESTEPDNYSKLIDTVNVTYGWTAFDISYIIDKFKTDSDYTTDFNGVIIKANSETASTWKKFVSSWGTSSKQPYISITYNDSPSSCPQVVSGATYYLKNYNEEYLDVYDAGTANNTRLLTYAYNGNANQQFKITYISGGEYEIAPQHTSGKVLSVNSSKQVILEEDSNVSRQRWYIFYREGKYHIVNKQYNTAVMAPTSDSDYISINNEYNSCCWEIMHIDPFDSTNIEYVRVKKYDMSSLGGDSEITTIVVKSRVDATEYFECFAPERSNVAFEINQSLIDGLNTHERKFQEYPTAELPHFYYHLAKQGADAIVETGMIEAFSAEYYGIWASEANRLLKAVEEFSEQVQLTCAVITTAYSIYRVVASIRAFYQATNTTQTISNTQYVTYYHQTRSNYLDGGIGYNSFDQAKSALGSAGSNKAWHHIVEQNQISASGFSATNIHNTKNLISIPSGYSGSVHSQITGHYASIQPYTNGMTVRQWLAGQSFQVQFEYGLQQLSNHGTVLATETGWAFIPN